MVVNLAKFIAKEQKDFLWENGFLGSENGKTVYFEDRAGTPKFGGRKLSVLFRT